MVLTPFSIFETIDPSILNPLEIHKRSEKFPKLREGGGGKIGNARKTKDLFLFLVWLPL